MIISSQELDKDTQKIGVESIIFLTYPRKMANSSDNKIEFEEKMGGKT